MIADREIVRALRKGGECCLIGSEEQPETISIGDNSETALRWIRRLENLSFLYPNIRIPDQAKMYSVNEADIDDFSDALRGYLKWLKRVDSDGKRSIRHRYIGAFVSDFHRNLLTGGIYMYPDTKDSPQGKVRLMYEANPLAFIVEQAGGAASDGRRRILDIVPTDLHQRVPLFIRNAALVEELERHLAA